MKKTLLGLSAIVLLTFFSCKSGEDKTAEAPEATIPADSGMVMIVRFPVADFATFTTVYNAQDSMRSAYGISKLIVAREIQDSSKGIIVERISDLQLAKDFTSSEGIKNAMSAATFTDPPTFDFVTLVRNDNSTIEIKGRIMIKHRVKDFDAWLKVYDGEGMKVRAEHGMIDRALARGAEDPNMVYIVFAISDMAKAQARSNSAELKATMMGAGVEGPPEIVMYTIQ